VARDSKSASSVQRVVFQIEKQKVNGKNCGIAALRKTDAVRPFEQLVMVFPFSGEDGEIAEINYSRGVIVKVCA
jgi:hypothetical protein